MPTAMNWVMPQLSSQIILRILDSLNPGQWEDRTALQSAALCSRAFGRMCQEILFREIHLHDIRGTHTNSLREGYISISKRSERLHRTLKKSPKLTSLIHKLTITISGYEKGLGKIKAFRELLAFIAGAGVPNLKSLHIKGDCTMKDNRSFEKRILYPFLTSRITHLAIDGVRDVPVSLISHCTNLVNLKLHGAQLEDPESVSSIRPGEKVPSLKTLDIAGSYTMINSLISKPSEAHPFLRLTRLSQYITSLNCPSHDIPSVTRILRLNEASLKTLDLSLILFNNRISGFPGMEELNFDACTAVEVLDLRLQISLHHVGNCRSRLDDIVNALQTVPQNNSLRTLNLYIHIHSAQYAPDFLGDCEAEWVNVDAELARIIGNRKVSVNLYLKYSTDVYKPATHIMAQQLEQLIMDIDRECFVLSKETIEGTFRFLFEMVNEYYSHASYCETVIYR